MKAREVFVCIQFQSGSENSNWETMSLLCSILWKSSSTGQRTVNKLNRLPTYSVNASSVNMFKDKIDKYLRRAGYT